MNLLTVEQAADELGCKPKTIEERARAGDLPGILWGDGGWRFPAQAFYDRLNQLAIEQAEKRRQAKQPRAVASAPVAPARKAPPALPTPGAQPSPRPAWRRT